MSKQSPPPAHSHYDVIVVGAGIAGCSAARALSLAQPGRKILLVDLHREHNPRFAGEFLHPRGVKVLQALRLFDDLQARQAVPMSGFLVHENADAPPVRLCYSDLQDKCAGLGIDHVTLNSSLRKQIEADTEIELCTGWRAIALSRNAQGRVSGLTIKSADRRQTIALNCDSIVAADGKRSSLRKLAKIEDDAKSLGFTVGLAIESACLPQPDYAQVLLGGPGPMLLYAIEERSEGRFRYRLTIDVPWGLPAKGDRLPEYLKLYYFPYLPGPIAAACQESLAKGTKLDLAPAVDLPAIEDQVEGLFLVGDAAGCSHPITASGMTMALLDAETLGRVAKKGGSAQTVWLNASAQRNFRCAHDRYVPTRQAVAGAIAEAFRGESEGARCIRRALFSYWRASPRNAQRSLALLSCVEARPQVFLSEYFKAAGHAFRASVYPQHASALPLADRCWKLKDTLRSAQQKFALVADVGWKQVKPSWWTQVTPKALAGRLNETRRVVGLVEPG